MSVAEEKEALRQKLRTILAEMSARQKASESTLICEQLIRQPLWQQARSVLLFHPLPDEPDIRPLITEALRQGKTLTLPRYSATDRLYEAAWVRNRTTDLVPGRFRIPEPAPSCPSFNLKHLDLTLVPGLGFTLDGSRLGRGNGFYDRLLTRVSGATCGIAFDRQITVEVPIEAHDTRLSCILTPTSWRPDVSQPRF